MCALFLLPLFLSIGPWWDPVLGTPLLSPADVPFCASYPVLLLLYVELFVVPRQPLSNCHGDGDLGSLPAIDLQIVLRGVLGNKQRSLNGSLKGRQGKKQCRASDPSSSINQSNHRGCYLHWACTESHLVERVPEVNTFFKSLIMSHDLVCVCGGVVYVRVHMHVLTYVGVCEDQRMISCFSTLFICLFSCLFIYWDKVSHQT